VIADCLPPFTTRSSEQIGFQSKKLRILKGEGAKLHLCRMWFAIRWHVLNAPIGNVLQQSG